jgi:hypothetical protein
MKHRLTMMANEICCQKNLILLLLTAKHKLPKMANEIGWPWVKWKLWVALQKYTWNVAILFPFCFDTRSAFSLHSSPWARILH